MKWTELLQMFGQNPVFESKMLLAGNDPPPEVYRQLSRWTKSGRLLQLRRGLYALADPWRKVEPHPFHVAARLREPSYISLQSALAYHGIIPEGVPVVTSVTTGRPERLVTSLGRFAYRHVKTALFRGYTRIEPAAEQYCFLAEPEKALLDLCHLTPGADSAVWIAGLRLAPEATLESDTLLAMAERSGSPKLQRCAALVCEVLS